ncbi:MAG: hypothetical protein GY810_06910, partial [Aureispira sp.]|nr:hypothetical protein [Aureispira sp.]
TPTISSGGATTFCTGGSVILTSSSATGNQWFLNGTPIGGATNQNYTGTIGGDYTVVVTANGCASSASSALMVVETCRIYVNHAAIGANNGTSWADAYTSLTISGYELWIAAGTYKTSTGSDRTESFVIASTVEVYGGFAGTETLLSQRNWNTNPTME